MGNREIKPSNKTKEEILEGFSQILITPPSAYEPVLEVETDFADSGAQSGSVSSTWLVILPMANCHIFQSQRVWARALRLLCRCFFSSFIRSRFQHSSCRINSTTALRGTFILELMPRSIDWPFFITIVREKLANCGDSSRISVNSYPICDAFGIFLTDS